MLFEIRPEHLDTGLRGIPVGYCVTSTVDPMKGLYYAGYPIADLAFSDPVEVIYLLYTGKKGSKEEVDRFSKELKKREGLQKTTLQAIQALPRLGHPMERLGAALFIASMAEGSKGYREDALCLIANIPQLIASVINSAAGWGETPEPEKNLGYIENFCHMLRVPGGVSQELIEAIRLFEVLHMDHGGGNLSTFVGTAVASGLESLWGSIAAATAALAGPRHGAANQESLHFLEEIHKEIGEASEEKLEAYLRHRLQKGGVIHGFGHAVLRVEDPRATVFYQYAEKKAAHHPLVRLGLLLRKVGPKVLKENPKISDPYPNTDAMSGALLTALGFPYPEFYTLLFALSRSVGIAIQIVYERCEARSGKGLPIVRPKYFYQSRKESSKLSS